MRITREQNRFRVIFIRGLCTKRCLESVGFPIPDTLFKERFHFGGRRLCAQGNSQRRNCAADEAGDDFIKPGSGEEDQPRDIHCRTDNNPGQRAGKIQPLPEKAQQDNRAECGTEHAPGIGYQFHDGSGTGVGSNDQGNHSDDEHNHTPGPEHFPVAGFVAADNRLVYIAGESGGGRQELAVCGRHGGSQNRRKQNSGNNGGEDTADHGDKDELVLFNRGIQTDHLPAEDTDQRCKDQNQGCPGDTDDRRFPDCFLGTEGFALQSTDSFTFGALKSCDAVAFIVSFAALCGVILVLI